MSSWPTELSKDDRFGGPHLAASAQPVRVRRRARDRGRLSKSTIFFFRTSTYVALKQLGQH